MSGILYAGSAAWLQASMVRMARAISLEDARLGRSVVTGSLALSPIGGAVLLVFLGIVAYPLSAWFFDDSAAGIAAAQVSAALLLLLGLRSEEHTSELQSLMRISYAVFCLKKKK